MAEKYINILKKTSAYRNWAIEYEELITNPALIKKYPELELKRKILPEKDFFVQINSPQNNIPQLLISNTGNIKAFEYELAWLMLIKDVESIANRIVKMKELGYNKIPRHIEEAALIYANSKGDLPDLGELKISNETQSNFNSYVGAFKESSQNSNKGNEKLRNSFGTTFMFYFHFK